jgi:tRNA-guanine family transglycosylase
MDFVASMTHRPIELRKILAMWRDSGDDRNPFARTIYTPLFAQQGVRKFMLDEFQSAGGVMFDSGGYFVQQGAITYESLYQKLKSFYNQNKWGSWYVLPDYVPTSNLSPSDVDERIQATITVTRLFFAEMPTELQARALPVVQGYTREQIKACVDAYADLGVAYIGFGSFATSGDNNSINMINSQSLEMVAFVKEQAQLKGLRLHIFGIGTPEVLFKFKELGVDSFDSSCWSRTAGYGNVYLPFIGRRNISTRMIREIGGDAYRPEDFMRLKDATGHDCPFCRDYASLKHNRIQQMMHNLFVIMDTVEGLNRGEMIIPELVGIHPSRYLNMRTRTHYKVRKETE